MLASHLDHIVIAAPSLAVGVEYVRRTLGVVPQAGGEHPRMGTHNCFVKLGPKVYLEIIAVNPRAAAPGRPRWFQLDDLKPNDPPRLATWVARTDDIEAAAMASPEPLGNIEPMTRGQLNWRITIPGDGGLPLQGIAPTLIQWPPGPHPTDNMPDLGCVLVRLEGFHPAAGRLRRLLEAIGFEGAFSVAPLGVGERPYLVAHVQTAAGPRQL